MIFVNETGGEWTAQSFSQRFRRLRNRCVDLGLIEPEKGGEKLVLYSTRHTRSVEMIRDQRVPLEMASKEMGHKHITTTVKHYLHLSNKDVTNAIRGASGVETQKNQE